MATTLRPPRTAPDLPIHLDPKLRNQGSRVSAALRAAIIDGLLRPGTRLPSSRSLADQLGVRRNAVVVAYEHLMSDGLVEARHGSGTFVATALPVREDQAAAVGRDFTPAQRRPFALGHTLSDPALLRRLARAVRRHIASAGEEELGYGDPRGSERLRSEIAKHLAAHRGVRSDPSCILIVHGTQHGLRLCVEALLSPGDAVWVEDPGYYAARNTLETAGLRPVPVPVDDQGLIVAAGRKTGRKAKAVYVTPSHQFPTGVTMSMPRRVALLEWARATGAWILEDDYDSEFRYAGPPLTALAGIGGEQVIYLGTFTKTLFAGLRIAYAVLPPNVIERVVTIRAGHDRFPQRFMQDAVADLMHDGTLAAHIRRMRLRYREARDTAAEAIARAAGDSLRLTVPSQGLHLLAELPPGIPTSLARDILAAADVDARLLSDNRISQSAPEGFILGFSGHGLDELRAAGRRLGKAARSALRI